MYNVNTTFYYKPIEGGITIGTSLLYIGLQIWYCWLFGAVITCGWNVVAICLCFFVFHRFVYLVLPLYANIAMHRYVQMAFLIVCGCYTLGHMMAGFTVWFIYYDTNFYTWRVYKDISPGGMWVIWINMATNYALVYFSLPFYVAIIFALIARRKKFAKSLSPMDQWIIIQMFIFWIFSVFSWAVWEFIDPTGFDGALFPFFYSTFLWITWNGIKPISTLIAAIIKPSLRTGRIKKASTSKSRSLQARISPSVVDFLPRAIYKKDLVVYGIGCASLDEVSLFHVRGPAWQYGVIGMKISNRVRCRLYSSCCFVKGCDCLSKWSKTHTVVLFLIALITFTLYKVQYETGIEIVPFLPIDNSGFDRYTESLLEDVEISEAARRQKQNGSIFCWVMTTNIHHKTRVPAVNSTWLQHCDSGHFYTNNGRGLSQDIPYHTIFNELPESYFKLFWKTRLALFYTYTKVSANFDWYFKGDEDTYVIVEHLRKYLEEFDPDKPHYIGYRLKRRMAQHGYNAGGPGYILSRGAMRVFVEKLFHNRDLCPYHEWEDLAIARCLATQGIYPADTRDKMGRQRFLAWRPEEHFNAELTRSFIFDEVKFSGFEIYHENLVSLHHLSPEEIRMLHGILYRVAPGISGMGAIVEKEDKNTSKTTSANNTSNSTNISK